MTESRPNVQAFPFCAVIGQQPFKLALILAAINPSIGGVLVSGPRGCAKSTLVRALADLRDHAPFVTLPLGASEEMLIGSLDLQQALNDKVKTHVKVHVPHNPMSTPCNCGGFVAERGPTESWRRLNDQGQG